MRTQTELVNAIFWLVRDKALNRKQITTLLGYKAKSPHLIDVLERLSDEGVLVKTEYLTMNNRLGFTYFANQVLAEDLENQKTLVS